MKTRNVVLVVALPFALFTSLAIAQADPAALLEELDADGNGSLSESEASANEMIMGKWAELDVDENSELSAEELAALAQ